MVWQNNHLPPGFALQGSSVYIDQDLQICGVPDVWFTHCMNDVVSMYDVVSMGDLQRDDYSFFYHI